MGSEHRFQYTVMGDTVNQADRFESANKCYGSCIIIGETTFSAVRERFETRLLDLIVVKGRIHPVRIYELLARRGEISAENKRVVVLYEEALNLQRERKFNEAAAKLDEALAVMNDEPSRRLRERILGYLKNPPPENWNGEFVNPEK
jgi:adenylate cyclase